MTLARPRALLVLTCLIAAVGWSTHAFAHDPQDYYWIPTDGYEEFIHTTDDTHKIWGMVLWDASHYIEEYGKDEIYGYEHEATYHDPDSDGEHWQPENETSSGQLADLIAWYSELPEEDYFDHAVYLDWSGIAIWTVGTYYPEDIPLDTWMDVTIETKWFGEEYDLFKRNASFVERTLCGSDDPDCMNQHDSIVTSQLQYNLDGYTISWQCSVPSTDKDNPDCDFTVQ